MVPLLNMQQGQQQMTMAKVSISILVMSLPVLYVSFLGVAPATLFRDTTFWFLMSNSIIVVIATDSGMLFFRSSSSSYSVDGVIDDRPFLVSGDINDVPMVVHGDDDAVSGAMESHAHALIIASGQDDVVVIAPESSEMVVDIMPSAAVARTAAQRARALTASKSLAREEQAAARRRRSRSHSHALVASGGADPVQEKSVIFVREKKLRRTATEGRHPRPTASAAAAEEAEKESEYARLSDEELNRRVEDFITRFNREIRLQIEKDQD